MKHLILATLGSLFLLGCGADGEPVKPAYTAKTTIGYNSVTGPFNRTVLSVEFGG